MLSLLVFISVIYFTYSLKTVLKFGGSSIKDRLRIENVAKIILEEKNKGNEPLVVFSAIDDTTNLLLNAGKRALNENYIDLYELKNKHYNIIYDCMDKKTERDLNILFTEIENILSGIYLINDFSEATKDLLVSYGERLSVRIISLYLNKFYNLNCKYFDSWDIGLQTDGKFNDANFLDSCKNDVFTNVIYYHKKSYIPIITGYICKDKDNKINTLGRGGSDLTATFVASCIDANEVQIWKDVNGLMTADPKKVSNAKAVPLVTYEEARELAYFGAKILHPISMQPAIKSKTPVVIKNSYNIHHPGTKILSNRNNKNIVTAITSKEEIILIDIISTRMLNQYGFLSKVFKIFEEFKISIDVIATSEISISLTINKNEYNKMLFDKLSSIACVNIKENYSIISLISDVSKSTYVIGKIFSILIENNIEIDMISQGASKNNISIILKKHESDYALNIIHDIFFY